MALDTTIRGTTGNQAEVDSNGALKVSVQGAQGAQAVTVDALPLPSGAATDAAVQAVGAKLPASLGTKASAAALAVVLASDQASIPVAATIQGTPTITVGNASMAVTGTFWQATQPVSISGTPSVSATISGTPTVTVGNASLAVTAAALPLPSGAATEATLAALKALLPTALDGSGGLKVAIVAGGGSSGNLATAAKGATAAGNPTSTAVDANTQALDVSIKGTPAVSISGTPSVTATISGTPAVSISGTPTVTAAGTLTLNGTALIAAPTTALAAGSFLYGWSSDQAGWLPLRREGTDTDGEAVIVSASNTPGILSTEAYPKVFNGTTWDRKRGNTLGAWVQGPGANGAAVSGNPLLMAGSDGTNARTIRTDALGEVYLVADGAPAAAHPTVVVAVGGSDGTNTQRVAVNAKGTQGALGLATQDLKDSGRQYVTLTVDAVAGVTTEAMLTFTKNVNGTATATQTSYQVTAGKTFRLQSVFVSVRAGAAAVPYARVRLRQAGSAPTTTSPLVIAAEAWGTAAAIGNGGFSNISIPDGLEVAGGQFLGLSHIDSVTTALVTVTVIGYEY